MTIIINEVARLMSDNYIKFLDRITLETLKTKKPGLDYGWAFNIFGEYAVNDYFKRLLLIDLFNVDMKSAQARINYEKRIIEVAERKLLYLLKDNSAVSAIAIHTANLYDAFVYGFIAILRLYILTEGNTELYGIPEEFIIDFIKSRLNNVFQYSSSHHAAAFVVEKYENNNNLKKSELSDEEEMCVPSTNTSSKKLNSYVSIREWDA